MWAAIFPGQGSQHPGMGKFLFENFKSTQNLFEEASDTLKLDFKKLCFEGSEQDLALTENTQPCLLLVSTATSQAVDETTGVKFVAASGHSIGEYAAVVAAGAMKFSDAVRAVRKRGEFMQSAVPVGQGGMLAVLGVTPEQATKLCRWAEEESGLKPIEPANFNAPGQIVISGSLALCTWLQAHFNKDIFDTPVRIKFIPLNVSAPFHCSLMKPAEEKMALILNAIAFQEARTPVVQNICAEPVQQAAQLRANLIAQISGPVRWVECIERLKSMGVNRLVELGAGRVLAGLVKKIDSESMTTFNINSLDDLRALESATK